MLNAGAYTAVDKAESEQELAFAVNGGAPSAFGEALLETGGRLLQVSTDFVFNGSQGSPYRLEQKRTPPLGSMAVARPLERKWLSSCWAPLLAMQGQGGE